MSKYVVKVGPCLLGILLGGLELFISNDEVYRNTKSLDISHQSAVSQTARANRLHNAYASHQGASGGLKCQPDNEQIQQQELVRQ